MPYRLCTLDLDGTLIHGTVFLALAEALGKGAEVRRLDAEYEAGRMSLEDNFRAEYAMFVGTTLARAQEAVRRGPWLQGIPEGVQALRAAGLRVGLLTDQPEFLARLAEPTLDPVMCSPGGERDGRIAESVELRSDKLAQLKAWCQANKVDLSGAIHVGNGTNDIPVFERVGLAVAVNATSPEVARRADLALEKVTDLRPVAEVIARIVASERA